MSATPSEPAPDPARSSAVEGRATPGPRRLWTAALVAGALAGVAAWLGGEAIYRTFQPVRTTALGPVAEQEERLALAALTKEASVAFTILGGVLGGFLGLAGGLARGSARAAIGAAVIGLVLGLVAATGVSALLLPIAGANRGQLNEDMLLPILLLGGIWAPLGAVGGLAFGLGLGGRGRWALGALGGLVGAALGTVLYEVGGAVAFPMAETGSLISATWPTRLLARLAVTLLAAAGSAMLVQEASRPRRGAAPGA